MLALVECLKSLRHLRACDVEVGDLKVSCPFSALAGLVVVVRSRADVDGVISFFVREWFCGAHG